MAHERGIKQLPQDASVAGSQNLVVVTAYQRLVLRQIHRHDRSDSYAMAGRSTTRCCTSPPDGTSARTGSGSSSGATVNSSSVSGRPTPSGHREADLGMSQAPGTVDA